MRHRVQGRKLGLPSDQRMALLKGLVRQLLAHQRIETTETRAKEVRRIVERLITLAKNAEGDTVAERRLSRKYLSTHSPRMRVPKPEGYGQLSPNEKARVTERIKGRRKERTYTSTDDFVDRLFKEVAPIYKDRNGGYLRMYKIGARRGDAAPMVILEFVDNESVPPAGGA